VFCDGISANGIAATEPLADAAKEAPAIPSTDTALLGRLPFKARFACGIAGFLLEQMRDEWTASIALFVRFE
jgi:hypothetical protein